LVSCDFFRFGLLQNFTCLKSKKVAYL